MRNRGPPTSIPSADRRRGGSSSIPLRSSIQIGSGSIGNVRSHGNSLGQSPEGQWGHKQPEKPKKKVTEPFIDLFDEGNTIRVIAEMPGISKEAIILDLQGSTLVISASNKRRAYHVDVFLPCKAKLGRQWLRNGILELILEKMTR